MGFYHVPSPAEYLSAFSFCLDCFVWGAFSAGWKVVVPLKYGVCFLWVGLDQWLVKGSWLWELVSVFWWVELDLFSLECNKGPVVSLGVSVCLVWLWAAHLLMFRVVFLFAGELA